MITIDKGSLDDLNPLLGLMREQFLEHGIQVEENALVTAMVELLRRDDLGFFLVAREEMEVVGFAAVSFAWTLEHGGKSAWLDELYIRSERRGQGLGSMLIDQVVRLAHQEGCRAIDLEVDQAHRNAERLYLRKGFKRLNRSRLVRHSP
jgi:GNAT superfamily N-acetyltransferase